MGFGERCPFVYPIFHPFHPEEREDPVRRGITLLTLLTRKEEKESSTQALLPPLSPGPLLLPLSAGCSSVVQGGRVVQGGGIPGVVQG